MIEGEKSNRAGSLVVYGAAAAVSAIMPLPMVDTWLGRLIRGAALWRVAKRHGIKITPEAREVLSGAGMTLAFHATRADRLLRRISSLSSVPAKAATSAEDGAIALLGGHLLDHYLARRTRLATEPIDQVEAVALRRSMDAAIEGGLASLAVAAPKGIGRALQKFGKALEKAGAEGRTISERIVDAMLDELADAPVSVFEHFVMRFEQALGSSEYCKPLAAPASSIASHLQSFEPTGSSG